MKTVIFFGTSTFAVPALERLAHAADLKIALVITQPDKPAGRGRQLSTSPVKEAATRLGIEVFQPESLRNDPGVIDRLSGIKADAFVVAAYGKILPKTVLDLPEFGCLNVHGSLLPKHRGASPVQAAIMSGETATGVTIMLMDEGLDTGPMLAASEVPISDDDTSETLMTKLADAGARLLLPTLEDHLEGRSHPTAQDEALSSVTKILTKEDGHIDWSKGAVVIERFVRAMTPWPRAWTTICRGSKTLHLTVKKASLIHHVAPCTDDAAQGLVCRTTLGFGVNCGKGSLLLERVQLEGKPETDGRSFLNGYPDTVGSKLGVAPDTSNQAGG